MTLEIFDDMSGLANARPVWLDDGLLGFCNVWMAKKRVSLVQLIVGRVANALDCCTFILNRSIRFASFLQSRNSCCALGVSLSIVSSHTYWHDRSLVRVFESAGVLGFCIDHAVAKSGRLTKDMCARGTHAQGAG